MLGRQDKTLVEAVLRLARAVRDTAPNPGYAPREPMAVVVGGFVRDMLLGLRPKDADIEVYGVSPDDLRELLRKTFGETLDVGDAFGIIKVPITDGLELDVSIPRRESKTGKGHAGFLIDSDPSLEMREAARRRDFTVNALAVDPLAGMTFDPFGGLEDLAARRLRVTDAERFQDDPLRVLRAMQLVARLGFSVEPPSEELMREMVARGDLSELSRERITEEFEKLLFKGGRPSLGLAFARRIGALEAVFPDMDIPDWDAWERALDRAASEEGGERHAVLAAFLYGFAPEARQAAADSLSFNRENMARALSVLRASERPETNPTNPANDARRLLRRLRPATPEAYASWLRALGRAAEADGFLSIVREKGITADPILQGRDLIQTFGLAPGPRFREILDAVEAARDRAELSTREEAVAFVTSIL